MASRPAAQSIGIINTTIQSELLMEPVIALSAKWHTYPQRLHWIAEHSFALEYARNPEAFSSAAPTERTPYWLRAVQRLLHQPGVLTPRATFIRTKCCFWPCVPSGRKPGLVLAGLGSV